MTGFHAGELAVQERAGVRADAARLVGMLDPADLDGGAAQFLSQQTFAVLTARDAAGSLWTSPLVGAPGFLVGHGTGLDVATTLRRDDPLADLPPGQPVGLIAIDLIRRRRLRVNGRLAARTAGRLRIEVDQAYGNCPQYIQQRAFEPFRDSPTAAADIAPAAVVTSADTFFLGTTHPTRGVDSSHRGGPPGFVRLDQPGRLDRPGLWWPDYPGNNMFNSFGNLAVDPAASLLFLDFATGRTLHLSGTASVEWTATGEPGDDGRTGRRVHFVPEQIQQPQRPIPVHANGVVAYPRNPPLSD